MIYKDAFIWLQQTFVFRMTYFLLQYSMYLFYFEESTKNVDATGIMDKNGLKSSGWFDYGNVHKWRPILG